MPNTPTSDVLELRQLAGKIMHAPAEAAMLKAAATIERLSAELERKTAALDAIVKSAIIGAASDAVETKQVALESIDDIASAALTEKEG